MMKIKHLKELWEKLQKDRRSQKSILVKIPDFIPDPPLLLRGSLRPLGKNETRRELVSDKVLIQGSIGLLVNLALGAGSDPLNLLGIVAGHRNYLKRENKSEVIKNLMNNVEFEGVGSCKVSLTKRDRLL